MLPYRRVAAFHRCCYCVASRRKDQLKKEKRAEELKKKRKAATLSFAVDDLEGDVEEAPTPVKGKTAADDESLLRDVDGAGPSSKRVVLGGGGAGATAKAGDGGNDGGDAGPAAGAGAGAGAGASAAVGAGSAPKKSKFGKDPTVETSFLPDQEREMREHELREQLKREWIEKQEKVKRERLNVTYSYWDGSGHRREITVPKGTTIGKFLEWIRQDMMDEFPELKSVSSENLLYVKEDLIIPHVSRVRLPPSSRRRRLVAVVTYCAALPS